MINVLIADDERIIREGLAFGVDWRSLDMKVIGLAGDGREAYNKILETEPELVIIDIRMPEMTGLDVIKAVREKCGDKITFIILSGYNDFTYAQTGISYGVAEYLLKPTDDDLLFETLSRVKEKIEKEKRRREFENETLENMKRQMPILREHLTKDYIVNSYASPDELEYYKKYLDFDREVRLILYQIPNEKSFDELFSLKSIITDRLGDKNDYVCFSLRNQLLLILPEGEPLLPLLNVIKSEFHKYYDSFLHIVYTRPQPAKVLPYMYTCAAKCTSYSFYLSDEYIIEMDSFLNKINSFEEIPQLNSDEILSSVSSGNVEQVKKLVNLYFDTLSTVCPDVQITKTYLAELYIGIIRCTDNISTDDLVPEIFAFSASDSIEKIKERIMSLAVSVSESNFNEISDSYSRNIGQAIKYINEHLSDNSLTLKYLCNNILFINVDYFGRLFKKETGEKFTHYITNMRIKKAKQIIADGSLGNIFEIAEAVGFGDGAQYFSQVFRKMTGYTPTEYREKKIYLEEKS